MPIGVGTGLAISAIAGGATAVTAAEINSSAAKSAAATTGATATHAADLQSQATAESLAFQKEQAENAFQNSEAARQGNYGQWAAQQNRLKSVGESLGIPGAPDMQIPSYVPGVDPGLTGSPTAPSVGQATPGSTPSSGSPLDPTAITQALTQNYQKLGATPTGRGSGPTDIAYYADQIAATGGLTPANQAYWFGPTGRIATDLSKTGAPTSASTSAPGSVGSFLTPQASAVPVAPPVAMPSTYAPWSVGSYLGAG